MGVNRIFLIDNNKFIDLTVSVRGILMVWSIDCLVIRAEKRRDRN